MEKDEAVEVVRAWHAALNDGDVERLVALSTWDVEVGGPRGTGRGADVLRQWFARAGVQIQPQQMFCRDQTVVVAQSASWSAPAPGSVGAGPTQPRAASPSEGAEHGQVPAGRQVGGEQVAAGERVHGERAGEEQAVASVFVVRDGRVARVVRYADLGSALQAAGLTHAEAV